MNNNIGKFATIVSNKSEHNIPLGTYVTIEAVLAYDNRFYLARRGDLTFAVLATDVNITKHGSKVGDMVKIVSDDSFHNIPVNTGVTIATANGEGIYAVVYNNVKKYIVDSDFIDEGDIFPRSDLPLCNTKRNISQTRWGNLLRCKRWGYMD